VKKPTTRGISAVAKKSTKSSKTNFEAIQRLNTGDLYFPYLVGLIEGDGWFSVTKNGNFVKYEFGIELHSRDIQLIEKLQEFLGVGSVHISTKSRNRVMYRVRKKSDLISVILPIFYKYPMFSNKQYDYLRFRETLLNDIKNSKDLIQYTRPVEPLNTMEAMLEKPYFKYWLIGFIEAEGCFSIYQPAADNSLVASFEISQTNAPILIEAIRTNLSFRPKGYEDKKTNHFKLKVTSLIDLETIINFLHNNPVKLIGHKKTQYEEWLTRLSSISRYKSLKIPAEYSKTNKISITSPKFYLLNTKY